MLIESNAQTYLKKSPVQASELEPSQLHILEKGTRLTVKAIAKKETSGHIFITLDGQFKGFNSWYIYPPHWISDEGIHPSHEEPKLILPENKGILIEIPGLGARYTGNPIDGCPNFLWGEATANGTRIPESPAIANNILKSAKVLENIRSDYNDRPVKVNSWYRDPETNRRIGGASQSQHLSGGAIDFNIAGISPWDIYARYNPTWTGGLAAVDRGSYRFCHIDIRPIKSRWSY
jgi:hypothetical protein